MMLSTALVLVAVLVLSVIASAQPGGGRGPRGPGGFGGGPGGPGGPGGGGGGIGMLLRNDDVKAQLGLSEDQIQKIEKIAEESRANRPQRDPNAGRPSAEEMEKMRAEMEKRRQETQDKIKLILSPEQQEKVKVLGFQISGGLSNPMVSADSLEVLNLTPDQKAKLKAIEDERGAAMREIFSQAPQRGGDMSQEERQAAFEKIRAKNEELRQATEAKIQTLLTDEQKAKAAKLTEEGKELRDKVLQQMRNRGGPQGGGGGAAAGEGGTYQPGANSWRPGQGAGNRQQGEGNRRQNGFPRATENQQ